MSSKLKNILKSIYVKYFKSRLIKIKRKLNRKDYSYVSKNPEKILLVDKKTADLFNEALYLKLNPDVKKAGIDAKEHFLKYGINEGRHWQDYSESKNLLVGEIIQSKFGI